MIHVKFNDTIMWYKFTFVKGRLLSLNHAAFHVKSLEASNRVAILASLC